MNDTQDHATGLDSELNTSILSVLHAAHVLEHKVEDALSRAGLSSPKFSALNALVENAKPMSLSELASRLSCVRSNMTQLVDRMEADGLVRRVADPRDRRAVRAAITDEGRTRHAAGAEEISRLDRELARIIQDSDRAALVRVLSALT